MNDRLGQTPPHAASPSRSNRRLRETAETCVAWLITQRPMVASDTHRAPSRSPASSSECKASAEYSLVSADDGSPLGSHWREDRGQRFPVRPVTGSGHLPCRPRRAQAAGMRGAAAPRRASPACWLGAGIWCLSAAERSTSLRGFSSTGPCRPRCPAPRRPGTYLLVFVCFLVLGLAFGVTAWLTGSDSEVRADASRGRWRVAAAVRGG
jgi:hypothetical protein